MSLLDRYNKQDNYENKIEITTVQANCCDTGDECVCCEDCACCEKLTDCQDNCCLNDCEMKCASCCTCECCVDKCGDCYDDCSCCQAYETGSDFLGRCCPCCWIAACCVAGCENWTDKDASFDRDLACLDCRLNCCGF